MPATVNLGFGLTLKGLDEAQAELDRLRSLLEQRGPHPSQRVAGAVLYANCTGRSRELLQYLPDSEAEAMTFDEVIDNKNMLANDRETRLESASLRAVYRNVKRVENRLLKTGEIDRDVVLVDSSGYGVEGANRYYLRPEDRAAIDELAT